MANADMCLEAARKAFPDNENLRVAYMLGFNEGFDRAIEQPEVDLDFQVFAKEMDAVFNLPKETTENTEENPLNWEYAIARHFYGLRNRALEEAARHVYESWMGGTMDDVRRDMVELGKVLIAGKED